MSAPYNLDWRAQARLSRRHLEGTHSWDPSPTPQNGALRRTTCGGLCRRFLQATRGWAGVQKDSPQEQSGSRPSAPSKTPAGF